MLLDIVTGIRIGVGIGLLVVGCIVVALAAFSPRVIVASRNLFASMPGPLAAERI
jgi:hypothetical protein